MPRITGRYERTGLGGEEVAAFIPEPLPPHDPPLKLGDEVASFLSRAEAALGRLDLASAMVPSVGWFLYSFSSRPRAGGATAPSATPPT